MKVTPHLALLGYFLQRVPLRNWSAWIGQHVRPMAELGPGCRTAQDHVTNGIRRSDTIVVNHGHIQRNFLKEKKYVYLATYQWNVNLAWERLCVLTDYYKCVIVIAIVILWNKIIDFMSPLLCYFRKT